MRTPVLAANWKMFKTTHETLAYVRELGALLKDVDGVEIVVAPPFTAIATAAEAARNTSIGIAAQNVYFETEGAFTGELSTAHDQGCRRRPTSSSATPSAAGSSARPTPP